MVGELLPFRHRLKAARLGIFGQQVHQWNVHTQEIVNGVLILNPCQTASEDTSVLGDVPSIRIDQRLAQGRHERLRFRPFRTVLDLRGRHLVVANALKHPLPDFEVLIALRIKRQVIEIQVRLRHILVVALVAVLIQVADEFLRRRLRLRRPGENRGQSEEDSGQLERAKSHRVLLKRTSQDAITVRTFPEFSEDHQRRPAPSLLELSRFSKEVVVVRDVGNADHQDAHLPSGAMHHAGRDVNQAPLFDRMVHTVQRHGPRPFQHVVELGGAFVVVKRRPINVHRMRPGRRRKGSVFMADEPIPPTAGAAFARGVAFVAD